MDRSGTLEIREDRERKSEKLEWEPENERFKDISLKLHRDFERDFRFDNFILGIKCISCN